MFKRALRPINYSLFILLNLAVAVTVPLAASARYAEYRGVTLGESVDTVVARLRADASAVKTLHETPSLIQELT